MGLDFLILYEHTVREYESDLLLKLELERRGYTAEIRQLLDRKKLKYFTYKKPRVLVSSCMYDNEAINSHVYNNIGRCERIVNLHWEQMLSDTQEEGEWFNMGGNAKKCIQTCWGSLTANRLVRHGMEEKNCPVTGAVMMDFLRPEFEGYFKTKEELCKEFGLDPAHQLHLYISSFGYASMTDEEVKSLSDMAGTDFSGFARTNKVSMTQTLDWFDRYLAAHPEVELVYRRHPSEWNSPQLEELAKKRPNFHVIFAGSVKEWIMAADSISIWMSTAIAEVYMAGKSCHILRPVPIEHEYDPVIYKDARYITTYEEFCAGIGSEFLSEQVKKSLADIIGCVAPVLAPGVKIVFDPTLVRGMGYYTGAIFEITMDDYNFSIAGGGRYDKMIGKFSGQDVAACGFSIGFERIVTILKDEMAKKNLSGAYRLADATAYLIGNKVSLERKTEVLAAARAMREQGATVTVMPMAKNIKHQIELLEAEGYTKFEKIYE